MPPRGLQLTRLQMSPSFQRWRLLGLVGEKRGEKPPFSMAPLGGVRKMSLSTVIALLDGDDAARASTTRHVGEEKSTGEENTKCDREDTELALRVNSVAHASLLGP